MNESHSKTLYARGYKKKPKRRPVKDWWPFRWSAFTTTRRRSRKPLLFGMRCSYLRRPRQTSLAKNKIERIDQRGKEVVGPDSV